MEWGAISARSISPDLSGIFNMQWIGRYMFEPVVDTGNHAAVRKREAGHEMDARDNLTE